MAYHHVSIDPRFQTQHGFKFESEVCCWAPLSFGLSVSAYTFCAISAVPAEEIRRRKLCTALINYVDDYIGGDRGPLAEAMRRARAAVGVLVDFGFLMNPIKLNLSLDTRLVGLGFLLDTGAMVIELPPARVRRFLEAAGTVRANHLSVAARDVSKVVGHILSCQLSHGLVCRLRSRNLAQCLAAAAQAGDYGLRVAVAQRPR